MECNKNILKQISSIKGSLDNSKKQLELLENQIKEDKSFLTQGSIENALISIEKANISFRDLAQYVFQITAVNNEKKKIISAISDEIYSIEIKKEEFGYRILLPSTLPRFGEKRKTILAEPLTFSLKKFNDNNKVQRFNKAVFAVINHISETSNINYIRDNDNYEYKDIINILSFWFLPDDSFKCCNIYNGTKISKSNYTEIFVIEACNFANFCAKYGSDIF